MTTPLGQAIQFFKDFGLFDIVLPFLLIFTIVFAILEKTFILGKDEIDGKPVPKRTLNTMVAFVVAMIVVATNEIVSTINQALPNIVLILVVIISFLMLIGSLYKAGDFDFSKNKKWTGFFIFIIFILIILVFAYSIKAEDGRSWLKVAWDSAIGGDSSGGGLGGAVWASILFIVIVIAAIYYITSAASGKSGKGGDN